MMVSSSDSSNCIQICLKKKTAVTCALFMKSSQLFLFKSSTVLETDRNKYMVHTTAIKVLMH